MRRKRITRKDFKLMGSYWSYKPKGAGEIRLIPSNGNYKVVFTSNYGVKKTRIARKMHFGKKSSVINNALSLANNMIRENRDVFDMPDKKTLLWIMAKLSEDYLSQDIISELVENKRISIKKANIWMDKAAIALHAVESGIDLNQSMRKSYT